MADPTPSRDRAFPGVPETIICVDCGGTAHLISGFAPDDPPQPGDFVAYRCEDCLDRWDLEVSDER